MANWHVICKSRASRIVAVEKLPGADANVMLELGGQLLLARVTRRSVDALNLTVGLQVFAQVKGVGVVSAPAD